METIYWLQVLGNVANLGVALLTLAMAVFVVSLIVVCAYHADDDETKTYDFAVKLLKRSALAIGIGLVIVVFVPSEKQFYAIYGVGGTIDYIKSNETARQLPDKVVNALDRWVDSQIEEDAKKHD